MDKVDTIPIHVIGAAVGLGAPDRRCSLGPDVIWKAAKTFFPVDAPFRWGEIIQPQSQNSNDEAAMAEYFSQLANAVSQAFCCNQRIAVVGGDHSCAIGTWSGVANALLPQKSLGLVWVDAHMDAHTPESSPSGRWHGMPVATLLGQGLASFIKITGGVAALRPENFCMVGVRSFETAESELLERLGVRVFTMDDVHRLGFDAVMQTAVAIATKDSAGYGISIDLDGINPVDAPGVGSPVVGGVGAAELIAFLKAIQPDSRFRALEIAEFNPVVDVEHKTQRLVLELLATLTEGGVDDESNH